MSLPQITAPEFSELKYLFGEIYKGLKAGSNAIDYNNHLRILQLLHLPVGAKCRYELYGSQQLMMTSEVVSVNYVHHSNEEEIEKRHVFLLETATVKARRAKRREV